MEKAVELQRVREPGDIIMETAYRRWLAAGSPAGGFVHFWLEADKEYESDASGVREAASIPGAQSLSQGK